MEKLPPQTWKTIEECTLENLLKIRFPAHRDAVHRHRLPVPWRRIRNVAGLWSSAAKERHQVRAGHESRPLLPEHEQELHVEGDVRDALRTAVVGVA